VNNLYNEEIKEKFLANYDNEQTQKTIRNVFLKSELVERVLDKDMYQFNSEEIGKVIANLNPHSVGVSKSYGRFIGQYLNWAIDNGYREGSNINPLKAIDKEFYSQFVDKTKKIHFNDSEFYEIVESLQNAQDQAFISLIYCGMLGERFSELQNLHYNHIHWNDNKIDIYDENNNYHRTITVPNQVMRYVENAYKQEVYYTINPETDEFNERELMRTNYVFRNTKSPRIKQGEQPVSQAVFYNRIKNIKAETGLSYLTPVAIKQSGIIHTAYILVSEKVARGEEPKLTYQDTWKIIGEIFNYAMFDNNGIMYYNTNLMKEFCNESTIKSLYNIDVII
jgi:integrase